MDTLQSRLDEFRKAFDSGAPPYNAPREAIEMMHRATAELKASGAESKALKTGDRAPEFNLFNQDHVQINSADLLCRGPLVVGGTKVATFFQIERQVQALIDLQLSAQLPHVQAQ